MVAEIGKGGHQEPTGWEAGVEAEEAAWWESWGGDREMEGEGSGNKVMWQSTIYYGSHLLGENPGAKEVVKYSEKGREQKHQLSVT